MTFSSIPNRNYRYLAASLLFIFVLGSLGFNSYMMYTFNEDNPSDPSGNNPYVYSKFSYIAMIATNIILAFICLRLGLESFNNAGLKFPSMTIQ